MTNILVTSFRVFNENIWRNQVFNFITLIVKQFIYRCKCQGETPTFGKAKAEIKLNYKIEQYNAHKFDQVGKTRKKWRLAVDVLGLKYM